MTWTEISSEKCIEGSRLWQWPTADIMPKNKIKPFNEPSTDAALRDDGLILQLFKQNPHPLKKAAMGRPFEAYHMPHSSGEKRFEVEIHVCVLIIWSWLSPQNLKD